ncbi:MAG TPA: prepilin-type N-terminal cleavage/methylation domain-containing protein [Candidatus Saccharimonadales bacterium]|jgi:prepilin-type N-terminal cleavage/methylation domain-containing protein|nr:prepilin-type N-terminal cleavage/methylation domain-containing protein [Candidatus Saccharimonadales bacterium]
MQYRTQQSGFSLIEILIVVSIILLLAGIVVPNLPPLVANYRLDAAGRSIAGLMQAGRIRAAQTNQANYVRFDTTRTPALAFVKTDTTTAYVEGDLDVPIASGYAFQTTGLPDHQQLDAYLGTSVVVELGTPVGFNSRGLPCVANNASGTLCQQLDPATPGAPGFEWYVRGTTANAWEAITITPGGRIKSWRLRQTGAAANSSCGYAACWN